MPIYEYQCPQCAHIFEEWVQVSSASNEAPCPQCGQTAVHIISNTAFVLKGSGWYVTEYGSHKNAPGEGQSETSGAGAVAPSADATATDSAAKTETPAAATAAPAAPAPVPSAPAEAKTASSPAPSA